ncbi:MAG: hypothetical protein EA391_10250 [Balneolaceae bacterium]|nr:MAG: hypothetical protein EA391_10250 [Balneolaceae bacterium]
MKRFLILLLFILLFSAAAHSQSSDELEYRLVRISIIPGLSTNGIDAVHYTARYSLNLLGGYHGGLDGFELGIINMNQVYTRGIQVGAFNASGGVMNGVNVAALANFSRRNMTGVQVSGLANISEMSLQGIQVSSFVNAGYGSVRGVQVAGIGNITRQDLQGFQFAGIFNASVDDSQGFQFAGVGNLNVDRQQGFAFAGVTNLSRDMQGFAIAGALNMTRNLQGFQVSGLANIAYRVRGMQVGLINLAHDFDGIPIGLISYYNNGRHNLDVWMSDAGFQNIGLKLGTRDIYNMVSLGYNPFLRDRDVWTLGWTIGTYKPLDEAWDNPRYEGYFRMRDLSIQNVQEGSFSTRLNSIYSFRYLIGRDLSGGFGIYAGPSFNLLLSREARSNEYAWYSILRGERGGSDFTLWVGFSAGFQFFGH